MGTARWGIHTPCLRSSWVLAQALLLACGAGMGMAEAQTVEAHSPPRVGLRPGAEPAGPAQGGAFGFTQQEQTAAPLDLRRMGYNEGDPDAPLKVLELSDFGCGYCRRFGLEVYPRLREIYMDGGFVEWKYVPISIGFPNGLQAAIAGECAGEQERFPALRNRLFREQGSWRNAEDPYSVFVHLAEEEGLDVERFEACVEGGWRAARVRDNLRLRGQLGVEGTPTFIIDGRRFPGALSLNQFRDLLDVALRNMGVEPPKR